MKKINAEELKKIAGIQEVSDDQLAAVVGGSENEYENCVAAADAAYTACRGRMNPVTCVNNYSSALYACDKNQLNS